MQKRKFKKLYNGSIASLRDFEVDKFIKDGGVIFEYEGQQQVMTPEDLKTKQFQTNPHSIPSRFNGSYKLIDYIFKLKVEDTSNQIKLNL